MFTPWRLLLYQNAMNMFYHVVTASLCLGGSDIFARIRENSPTGELIANLTIGEETGANSIRLCLTGENADWFYLDGTTIRLNSSFSRALDREVQGSILIAALTCYEENVKQNQYRIVVEILNENDNKPRFLEKTIQPFHISELKAVNSVVFTVKAIDADGDTITYILDKSWPDASYFRIDLPNSGKIVLDKPLDFETKTQLQLVIYAVETNTREKYNTTASLTVNIKDGDDQYPQFLPCAPVSPQGDMSGVCTNPIYAANITDKDEDVILEFVPGPIHAKDGDISLDTPLAYSILSGADDDRFIIDNQTAQITLKRRVENKQLTPSFTLRVMASQRNDPKKYTVTTALVRVRAENRFPSHFNKTIFKGFVIQSPSPATIVSTYGSPVLLIHAIDEDFRDGVNPNIHYSLHPLSVSSSLYQITLDGVVIARTDRLKAFDRHIFEVVAVDEESGDVATASLDIEVLQRGLQAPGSMFGGERPFVMDMDTKLAGGIAGGILLLLVAVLIAMLRMVRRKRKRQDPAVRGAIAVGKHPNVSLSWFQMVNSSQPMPLGEEVSYQNDAFTGDDASSSGGLHGRPGVYTRKQSLPLPPSRLYNSEQGCSSRSTTGVLPLLVIPEPLPRQLTASLPSYCNTTDLTTSKKPGEKDVEQGKEMARGLYPVLEDETYSKRAPPKGLIVSTEEDADENTNVKEIRNDTIHTGQITELRAIEQEAENPYTNLPTVIYDSDQEETPTEDNPSQR
ncbi:cadherin-related family member 5 [Aplochiton taeniatus]